MPTATRRRTAVVWLRRDLRIHDHPALHAAVAAADDVAPLFVVDPALVGGRFRSPNRIWFMLETLRELADEIEAAGGRLHVRVGRPTEVVPAFAAELGAARVHVSRDYTPFGRARDRAVADRLAANGRTLHAAPGLLVHEPEEVARADGGPYAVFTAFQRAWSGLPRRAPLPAAPATAWRRTDGATPGRLPSLAELGVAGPTADAALLLEPGETAARARLDAWVGRPHGAAADAPAAHEVVVRAASVDGYADRRDLLAGNGTSRLGQDLRFGLLSPIEVAARVDEAHGPGRERFLTELAWRDFYAHVLWHRPAAARASFQERYDRVPWRDDPAGVEAWRAGRTGYPVVDAAMRQLRATGWMPNRARMIVASFLAKDLLVDWRVGEAWFMRHLVDGDPASNNGGWQWAASTGTDAQPYFRVFNPVTQGERFDPGGAWVRCWLPELTGVPDAHVHAPWTMPADVQAAAGCRIGIDYPAPIVDHAAARMRAIEAFASVRA